MKTIAIAGTFDTKGKEYLYVKGLVEELGMHALTIHTGVFEPEFTPDVSNAEVAAAAGYDIRAIVERKDRAMAQRRCRKEWRHWFCSCTGKAGLTGFCHLEVQGELPW